MLEWGVNCLEKGFIINRRIMIYDYDHDDEKINKVGQRRRGKKGKRKN